MTDVPSSPHLTWRPLRMVLPLDLMEELDADWTNSELRTFVRARLLAGDPGPLYLDEGVASTPLWDLECAREDLLDLLRWREDQQAASPEEASSKQQAASPEDPDSELAACSLQPTAPASARSP